MKLDKFESRKSLFYFRPTTRISPTHRVPVHSLPFLLLIMSAKIVAFTTLLQAGPYEISPDFQDFIVKSLADSKLNEPIVINQVATPVAAKAETKTKKATSYNIFVSEKMKSLTDIPSNERMAAVGALWKAISPEEKALYEAKAKDATPYEMVVSPNQAKKGPKTLTNWQFFVSEKMPEVKAMADVPAKGRLGKIGEMWKLVSTADKEAYKTKAGVKDVANKQAKALLAAQA